MKNLITDLIKFQQNVPVIPKNCTNPFFSQGGKIAKYADLATVIDTCKPVLNANNLAVIQCFVLVDNKNSLVTTLFHASGESISSSIYLPDIQDAQKLTAAITYLRRSSYLSIVGLVGDDDNDGNELNEKELKEKELQRNTFNPRTNEATDRPASDKQKEMVKKNYPGMDVSNISMKKASELIQASMKGK